MAQSSTLILVLTIIFTFLALLFVCLRLWVRSGKAIEVGPDDWVIVAAAAIFVIAYTVPVVILTTQDHLGDHVTLTPTGKPAPPSYRFDLWSRIVQSCSPLPIGLTKVSVLLFYRRIFRGSIFTAVNWSMFGLSIAWTIVNFITDVFQCHHPIAVDMPRGQKCIKTHPFYYVIASSDFLIDLAILAIPIPIIWKLHMPPSHKFGVTAVFLLGSLTVACSITRLVEFVYAGRSIDAGSQDYTWVTAPTVYWSMLEASIGIISACLITLRPAFRGWSAESVLRSVRSALSLHSIRSKGSTGSKDSHHTQISKYKANKDQTSSGSSVVGLTPGTDYLPAGGRKDRRPRYDATVESQAISMDGIGPDAKGIVVEKSWANHDEIV